jgi:hypothetical protein
MPLSKSNSINHGGSFSADEQGVEISPPPHFEEGQEVLSMDDADDEPTDAHNFMMTPSNEDDGSVNGKRRHGIAVKALKVVLASAAVTGTIWAVNKSVKSTNNTAALMKAGKSSKSPTVSSKGSKSAQPSSQPSFEPSMSPSTQPSNQPSDPPVYVQCGQSVAVAGGGWTLVRHVPAGNAWHPANDQLAGTQTYGDSTDDSNPWSVNFETAVNGWDEFLFATGDCTKWLAATKEAVLGGPPTPAPYAFAQRSVLKSSVVPVAHTVQMGFRSASLEDPLISLDNYLPPDPTPDSPKNCLILHIEDSWARTGGDDRQCVLRYNDGANVYVRKSSA